MLSRGMRNVYIKVMSGVMGLLLVAASAWAEPVVVEMKDGAFVPAVVEIKPGAAVKWVNRDGFRQGIVGEEGARFRSVSLRQGDAFVKRFRKPGEFTYRATENRAMQGVVIVR